VRLYFKNKMMARSWWVMPVILATREAETRRIEVGSQPGQMVHKIVPQKIPS
jgi:hypothetical protein